MFTCSKSAAGVKGRRVTVTRVAGVCVELMAATGAMNVYVSK